MFLRGLYNLDFQLNKTDYLNFFDEWNISKVSHHYIKKISKRFNNQSFYFFKYWILFRWIRQNFQISEWFLSNLKKNIQKLDVTLNENERTFVFNIEELVFTSWRPLKSFPIKFEIEKRENVCLLQKGVNIHEIVTDQNNKIHPKIAGIYDLYFSHEHIYLCDENQVVKERISLKKIESYNLETYGTIVIYKNKKYLYRGRNKPLTYVILSRLIGRHKTDINDLTDKISYFDLFNNLLGRFN